MITAYAHTNIALIKYWGKLPGDENLPATGSLSMTLDRFGTRTSLSFTDSSQDQFYLDDTKQSGEALSRVQNFLDLVREKSQKNIHCLIESHNDVPTSAGLASSASAFAALAIASNALFELDLEPTELSKLARRGSGSAARSILGGFAILETDHAEAVNTPLDFKLIVVQCAQGPKKISSREAMNRTAATSPYYNSWVQTHSSDLKNAHRALLDGDFQLLGELTEHSTLKMHANLLAAKPGIWYLEPLTLIVMNRTVELRQSGIPCYFTMDAGPHVKVLCLSEHAHKIARELKKINPITSIDICSPGPGAYLC